MDNNIRNITVMGGLTKNGEEEPIRKLEIRRGEILALVGPTGSGKSMLLADIEQVAAGDTPSKRIVLINGEERNNCRKRIIAQLSQTMNFVVDMTVGDFLELRFSTISVVAKRVDETKKSQE